MPLISRAFFTGLQVPGDRESPPLEAPPHLAAWAESAKVERAMKARVARPAASRADRKALVRND